MKRTGFLLLAAALPASLFLGGCANTTTTRIYRDNKGTLVVEYPKDLVAEGVDIDAGDGKPRIKIARWESKANPAVTGAQGQREAADVAATSSVIEAAVRGAVKSQTGN
ncbi:MAG TPA: hypothetical protein VIM58_02300 [Candidatus Methylacidiphilales bacterium]